MALYISQAKSIDNCHTDNFLKSLVFILFLLLDFKGSIILYPHLDNRKT